jgi:hypothetical protein
MKGRGRRLGWAYMMEVKVGLCCGSSASFDNNGCPITSSPVER